MGYNPDFTASIIKERNFYTIYITQIVPCGSLGEANSKLNDILSKLPGVAVRDLGLKTTDWGDYEPREKKE